MRRLLQFSLRTFLVLVTAFGVWLGFHVHAARKQRASVAAIEAKGGRVQYDFEAGRVDPFASEVVERRFSGQTTGQQGESWALSWVPKWLLASLGVDLFHDVVVAKLVHKSDSKRAWEFDDSRITDDVLTLVDGLPRLRALYVQSSTVTHRGMEQVGKLKNLESLVIWRSPLLTDEGIRHLGSLSKLRRVAVRDSQLGDESLEVLASLPRIESLSLEGNSITDKGLAFLAGKTQLRELRLAQGTDISDAGLVHLARLTRLEQLDLAWSSVTNEGLGHLRSLKNLKLLVLHGSQVDDPSGLRQALPGCRIVE